MRDVYITLCNLDYFIDNDYLKNYARLIERHARTSRKAHITNSHHIIPKSWFKLNNCDVDNSLSNLVNLPYREHVLAHYYLCLCTRDQFQYANELALVCLVTRKKLNYADKYLIQHLSMYNNIYEDYLERKKNNYRLYS